MRPESRSLAPAGRLPAESHQGDVSLADARAAVAGITTRHYENFPVASLLVPGSIRPAVRAVYAFARGADDFADEPEHAGHRMARLDEWERLLRGAFAGEATEPVFVALAEAVRRHALPIEPFLDLLAAFKMDAVETRYADWEGLVGYCRLSANPVGRIILHLFGRTDADLLTLSNSICTGLQLANHWQDLAIDAARGRFYVPADAMRRHGLTDAALVAGVADERFRGLMRDLVTQARRYFLDGRPLCDRVTGRLRAELRLTWHGGIRVLERLEAAEYDVFRRRPRLGLRDACVVSWRTLLWRS